MIRSIVLFFCLVLSMAHACYGLQVTFRSSATVKGIVVRLADVADFDLRNDLARALGSQVVSSAPSPGRDIVLQTANLIQGLTGTLPIPASVQWQGPAQVLVHREGTSVGPKKIQTIIAGFLDKHQNDLPDAKIRFVPNSLPLPFILPSGDLTWDVVPSDPEILRSTTVSIIFSVDGHVRKNIAIQGHIKALAPVVVAASSIRRGSILAADQIRIVTRDIAKNSSPCLDAHEIIGEKANRTIREGSIIEHEWIDIPPMVARGQMVKIILNESGLHIETTGMAHMNGIKNQVIRVQNISSKKILYCRVTAPGIVEVQL